MAESCGSGRSWDRSARSERVGSVRVRGAERLGRGRMSARLALSHVCPRGVGSGGSVRGWLVWVMDRWVVGACRPRTSPTMTRLVC
jgi:hypothetical protein